MVHRRLDLIDRIVNNSVPNENGCWIWQGSTSGNPTPGKTGRGYGKISVNGISSIVHRVMYICYNGYIPSKFQVDHLCCNRLCCNPEHLEAVTAKKNNDRKLKRLKNKK